MIIDDLIYDREYSDVARLQYLQSLKWDDMTAEEQAEWESDLKGGYNASDLNRVETAAQYMANELIITETAARMYANTMNVAWDSNFDFPYDPDDYDDIVVKTDWDEMDIPSNSQMTRYLDNIKLLRDAITAPYPVLPDSMNNLTYNSANAIEQVIYVLYNALLDVDADITDRILRTSKSFVYSGQPNSGMIWTQFM